MCITFLFEYPGCNHSQYIGGSHCPSFHSQYPGCQLTYRLKDDGNQCKDCVLLNRIQLHADFNPIVYQPCTQGFPGDNVPQPTFEDIVRASRRPSPASLSDVDSETSYWKLDLTENERGNTSGMKSVPGVGKKNFASKADEYTELTPQTARHRDLVQQQLANLGANGFSQNDGQYANVSEENDRMFQRQLHHGFLLLQKHIDKTNLAAQAQNPQPLQHYPRWMMLPANYFPPLQATPELFGPGRRIPDLSPHPNTTATPSARRSSKSPTRRSAASRSPTRKSPARGSPTRGSSIRGLTIRGSSVRGSPMRGWLQ